MTRDFEELKELAVRHGGISLEVDDIAISLISDVAISGDEQQIPYDAVEGYKRLFYPDFIIKMKSGKSYLFDTKTKSSDANAPAKHNALIDYMHEANNHGADLVGGVLIEVNGLWKYCTHRIADTKSFEGWGVLHI